MGPAGEGRARGGDSHGYRPGALAFPAVGAAEGHSDMRQADVHDGGVDLDDGETQAQCEM